MQNCTNNANGDVSLIIGNIWYLLFPLRSRYPQVLLERKTKLINRFLYKKNIFWGVLLNRVPTSTQLHPPSSSTFQPSPSSLQLPQRHWNQNIGRNQAISPNLGQKIQSCLFWLKIGPHSILQVPIPNPDLDFWNSDPKIYFWANLGQKNQSCPFCPKIDTHGISKMLSLILFRN